MFREGNEKCPTILDNDYCPYCGELISKSEKTKEHVIGRRFVPDGALENCWNLILNCCRHCNNSKSNLEDDISVISQLYGAEKLSKKLNKKIQESFSRRTNKKIIESNEKLNIELNLNQNVRIAFPAMIPPQIDKERMIELALYYCQAFFYFLTYSVNERRGYFFESFKCINVCEKSDWGNKCNKKFQDIVFDWKNIFHINTANNNFRVRIREYKELPCWSWAIELNKSYRIIGFFGNEKVYNNFLGMFNCSNHYKKILENDVEAIYFRREIPLAEKDDFLFK